MTAKSMRRHIKTTHQGVKEFHCHYEGCCKSYRHKNGLEEHIRTHTGEKPWKCRGCDMRFHASKTWRDHEKKFCPVLHNRKYRASNLKYTSLTSMAASPRPPVSVTVPHSQLPNLTNL